MSIDDLEQRLRSSLDRQAAGQSGHGADLADVLDRARRIRRRRTALAVAAVAAAVVAVTVPAGVLVASHDTSAPPPPAGTVSTVPTPGPTTPAPTASGAGLGGIAMGRPTTLTYLDPTGAMHHGQPLPGGDANQAGGRVSAFTPYHGGWLVAYDDSTMTQFGADGRSVADHPAGAPATITATITASEDGTQTAWQIGQDVYAGIASGMGDGQQHWTVGPSAGLLGFLDGGLVVSTGRGYTILTGPSSRSTIDSVITPTAVSQAAGAVGGVVGTVAQGDQQGALADAKSGAVYWTGSWKPLAFSPDGKYAAAIPVVGDPSAIAILDARTGRVIARTPDLSKRLYLSGQLTWDGDRVVFGALGDPDVGRTALFALSLTGQVEQVSPTVARPGNGYGGFVFMTR
jgi:hypothetical protein